MAPKHIERKDPVTNKMNDKGVFADDRSPPDVASSPWRGFFLHQAFIPTVLLVGLTLRLVVAVLIPIEQMSDSAWYVARAIEIASGLGYQEDGIPTAYWPVGWPAILAGGYWLTGSIPLTVIGLNLAGSLAIMLLILWFGRALAGSEVVGRIALLAYALYPNHIAYSSNAATEIIYTALLMAAFALMIAGRNHVWKLLLSGLIFGVVTLVKPQTIGFPFGAAVGLFLVYHRSFSLLAMLRAMLVVYVSLLVVVLPWSYRNFLVFDTPVLVSTNGGTALFMGANDQSTGTHYDYQNSPAYEKLGIPWDERVARQIELDKEQRRQATQWIRDNTGTYLAWMPKKVAMLWVKDTDGFWVYEHDYSSRILAIRTFQLANQLFYMLVVMLSLGCLAASLIGLWERRQEQARLTLLFCMPAFVSLVAAVFTGQIRYHFAAMPFLFVAAAWMAVEILNTASWRESFKFKTRQRSG